jgi:hypothetical protein
VGTKGEGTIDAAEYVKVVDFGIANARGDIGGAEGVCGTPEFMPPEQAQGQSPDPRDDVYAFGCLMYQVLTGDVPFRAEDVPKVLLMHLREPVQPPRQRRPDLEIPPGAQDIVMRALEKKREDRWQSMAEVAEKLAAVELPREAKAPAPAPARPKKTSGPLPTASSLRSRVVMPKEKRGFGARKMMILGAAVLVGAVVLTVARHAMQNAPGRIEIETEPTEAEIYIDGQKMADRSPMFLDASPGTYRLVVRSPGYAPVERVLEMKPRGQDVVALALVPVAQPKADTPPRRPRPSAAPAARSKAPAAPAVDGVTFIDFKKSSAAQKAR